jgi:hypothetical protein
MCEKHLVDYFQDIKKKEEILWKDILLKIYFLYMKDIIHMECRKKS